MFADEPTSAWTGRTGKSDRTAPRRCPPARRVGAVRLTTWIPPHCSRLWTFTTTWTMGTWSGAALTRAVKRKKVRRLTMSRLPQERDWNILHWSAGVLQRRAHRRARSPGDAARTESRPPTGNRPHPASAAGRDGHCGHRPAEGRVRLAAPIAVDRAPPAGVRHGTAEVALKARPLYAFDDTIPTDPISSAREKAGPRAKAAVKHGGETVVNCTRGRKSSRSSRSIAAQAKGGPQRTGPAIRSEQRCQGSIYKELGNSGSNRVGGATAQRPVPLRQEGRIHRCQERDGTGGSEPRSNSTPPTRESTWRRPRRA